MIDQPTSDLPSSRGEKAPSHYRCNVCGSINQRPGGPLRREGSGCARCGSSVRLRGLALLVARELTGLSEPISDLPVLRSLRGMGMSDLDPFARPLEQKFSYTNTYFHQPPRFDATQPDPSQFGLYDFITSSEILEHVPPPVETSFANLAKLLKPGGLLLFTVPYRPGQATATEHFPDLSAAAVVELDGEWVLVNRRRDGTIETRLDLVFHGGDGSTLEMRVFSEAQLRTLLANAGFTDVRIAGEPYAPFGIEYENPWSLPIAARKTGARAQPFEELALRYSGKALDLELARKEVAVLKGEYARHTEWAEGKIAELEQESRERLEHGVRIEREFGERTAWALQLKSGLESAEASIVSSETALEKSESRNAELQAQLESARAALEQTNRDLFVRILKKLGLVRVRST